MEENGLIQPQLIPSELIQVAIAQGADLEKLEKLLSLQERWQANEAKKAYNKAMSSFKANPPKIDKDRLVEYSTAKGKTRYSHASLYNVVNKITVELSKHGLSASWRTEQVNNNVKVSCRISHELGHFEETSLVAESDTSGSKNPIQAIGSTVSYLERYTILSITGLATEDQDNDGNIVEPFIDENKVKIIKDLIKETSTDEKKLLEYMAVESVEKIPASQFAKAKIALESKRKKS